MFKLDFDVEQLESVPAFLNSFTRAVNNPSVMGGGLRTYGNLVARNFASRGAFWGNRWQPISRYTKKVRDERGIPETSPTLVQSGWLKLQTAQVLGNWSAFKYRHSSTDFAYSGPQNDGRSTATGVAYGRYAHFKISGPKANNMTAHTPPSMEKSGRWGAGYVPARPFFGMDRETSRIVGNAIAGYLMFYWYNGAPRGTVIKQDASFTRYTMGVVK